METEGGVGVSQIPTFMELIPTTIGIQSELVVITTKVPTQMWRGFYYVDLFYTLPLLRIVPIDALAIVANIEIRTLQTHVTFKIVPLVIPHIKVHARIIMLETTPHASKVFTTLIGVLVDTHVVEKSKLELGPLVKSIVESLVGPITKLIAAISKKILILWTKFGFQEEVMLTQIFIYCK